MYKKYLVPNLFTTANLFCGFWSLVESMQQNYVGAAWAILAAAVFDMLDGRLARMLKATSQFGTEYDSLSDLLSFGVAPGILLYQWALAPYGHTGVAAAFSFIAGSALRLARFNIQSGHVPKNFFRGLPTPMAAGVIAAFVLFNHVTGWPSEVIDGRDLRESVALWSTFSLAGLMVSTIRFPSFKKYNWRSHKGLAYLAAGALGVLFTFVKMEISLFLLVNAYVALSLVWNIYRLLFRRGRALADRQMQPAEATAYGGELGDGAGGDDHPKPGA